MKAPSDHGIYPRAFSSQQRAAEADAYRRDPATLRLLEFFERKGLAAIKEEDQRAQWYEDWLAWQARHGLYAAVLSPAQYSSRGGSFDLLRYVRFLEVFAYCSPAHGYSLQVTFLGLFAILMGSNEALKREAVARLEAGELLAFGVSEREHGSDLMANEFRVAAAGAGRYLASGSKYYIGNANAASIIAVLARKEEGDRVGRAPFVLWALRPERAGTWTERKIHTLGVRAAHVGAFEVREYPVEAGDVIAEGRQAWDAVFGTVTLGKFFLGFGSIGMCERALEEAVTHLRERMLYGKPALDMAHLRARMAQAYARLLAMKLYAYRTLDYVHGATAGDRRYQLYCAVQKAKVSTEGVKVMALVSECVGAKGFEGDTYCEMALRDVALIPGLEGSMHINLGLAAQVLPRYFARNPTPPPAPPSQVAGDAGGDGVGAGEGEIPYLMTARTGGTHTIAFGWFLDAYRELADIPNVALFVRQAAAFRRVVRQPEMQHADKSDTQTTLALGQCLATIAYGQLVAENALLLKIPRALVSVIFSLLVMDLSTAAMQLAAIPSLDERARGALARMMVVPRTSATEWDFVAEQLGTLIRSRTTP